MTEIFVLVTEIFSDVETTEPPYGWRETDTSCRKVILVGEITAIHRPWRNRICIQTLLWERALIPVSINKKSLSGKSV